MTKLPINSWCIVHSTGSYMSGSRRNANSEPSSTAPQQRWRETLLRMGAAERAEPRRLAELRRLAVTVEAAAEQQPRQQHREHDEAHQAQPALRRRAHHELGATGAEETQRQHEAGEHEEQRHRRRTVDRGEANAAQHCRRWIEAIDDADAGRIERPEEVPRDDDECREAAQRLELHELAVAAGRGGGTSSAWCTAGRSLRRTTRGHLRTAGRGRTRCDVLAAM